MGTRIMLTCVADTLWYLSGVVISDETVSSTEGSGSNLNCIKTLTVWFSERMYTRCVKFLGLQVRFINEVQKQERHI